MAGAVPRLFHNQALHRWSADSWNWARIILAVTPGVPLLPVEGKKSKFLIVE